MAVLRAPVGLMEGKRRPLRPWHARMTIEDLLILTWRLPPGVLAARLPAGLAPWIHEGRALVSALLFRYRSLRPAFIGFPRFGCCQMNLRSYVLDPGSAGPGTVYFHGLFSSSRMLARLSSFVQGIPSAHLPLAIRAEKDGARIALWKAEAEGSVRVRARETDAAPPLPGALVDATTNPHTGLFAKDGGLRGWSCWHRAQELRTMSVEEASVGPLEAAGLARGLPDHAHHVASIDYEVYFPSRPVTR